jgi:NAD(P)-dependent dehydrogenase (short-subunit alcohol dehydrogenase family)
MDLRRTHEETTTDMPKNEFVKQSLEPLDLIFSGKVALITGRTREIGAATLRCVAELKRKGSHYETARARRATKSNATMDLRHSSKRISGEGRLIVPFTVKTFGPLDCAFNNAGIPGDNRSLVDQTEENFDRVFAVNVKPLFLLLRDELKQMIV